MILKNNKSKKKLKTRKKIMKKLLCLIAVMATIGAVNAQVNFFPLKKQDTIRSKAKKDSLIVKVPDSSKMKIGVFVSMLSEGEMPFSAIRVSQKEHIRGGATFDVNCGKIISFTGFTHLQLNSDVTTNASFRFWMQVRPLKGVSMNFGSIVSVSNEQKPPAVSDGSEFESYTHQHVAGGGVGVKLKYELKGWEVAASVIERRKLPEYSAGIGYKEKDGHKEMKLAVWYTQDTNLFGAALTLKFKLLSTTLVWNQDHLLANVLTWNLPKKWQIYTDIGVDLQNYELIRGELGVLKNWEIVWSPGVVTKIMLGPAFNYENNAAELYLQIGF
jgi:hypothetical protein